MTSSAPANIAGLTSPGSSTYDSSTMTVGDGTWDSTRNSFLLPNIQGLNFDTMRYNGMGNRFRALQEYHPIVTAHGVIAAITFLGVVPVAILIASFYYKNPRLALRIHISLQILTVILTTVIFILGYFAVGPSRSLTNPHHGIGVAIYVLVLIQAIGGALIHKIEKGKMRYHIPLKLMLHQWFGRAIALLALAQIPIGLTLYGSPAYLFVLYTLVVAFLVVLYFVLTYQRHKRAAMGGDDRGSYLSGTQTDLSQRTGNQLRSGRFGKIAGAVGAGAGIAALRRRLSNREDRGRDRRTDVSGVSGSGMHSRVDSSSYLTEKDSYDGRVDHKWRNRILGGAAGIGVFAGARRFFNGGSRRDKDGDYESEASTNYRPPLGGPLTSSIDHVDRLEAGVPVYEGNQRSRRVEDRERAQADAMGRSEVSGRSGDSLGEYSSESSRGDQMRGRGGALAGVAGAIGLGGWLQRRKSKKEQARVDAHRQQEQEVDKLYRPAEQQPLYPGGGTPARQGGVRFDPNLPSGSVANQRQTAQIGPNQQPTLPSVAADPYTSDPYTNNPYAAQPPPQNIPPPPMASAMRSTQPPQPSYATDGPPPPPMHRSGNTSSAGTSPDRRQRAPYISNNISNNINTRAAEAGTTTGVILPGPPPRAPQQPQPVASPPGARRNSDYSSAGDSPAVSLRVKPHRDGRHVTVQQLSPEQAASRRRQQRRDSSSELGYMQSPLSQESTGPQYSQTAAGAGTAPPSELHLPPTQQGPWTTTPIAISGFGSSPGTAPSGAGGHETVESYEDRRRRRRAERARQKAGTSGGGDIGVGDAPGPSGGGRINFD